MYSSLELNFSDNLLCRVRIKNLFDKFLNFKDDGFVHQTVSMWGQSCFKELDSD